MSVHYELLYSEVIMLLLYSDTNNLNKKFRLGLGERVSDCVIVIRAMYI